MHAHLRMGMAGKPDFMAPSGLPANKTGRAGSCPY